MWNLLYPEESASAFEKMEYTIICLSFNDLSRIFQMDIYFYFRNLCLLKCV